jgi:hypothetical protein
MVFNKEDAGMPPKQLRVTLTEIGQLDDICPYCGQALNKRPTKRTLCLNCQNFIYVKIRPIDHQEVLVTKEQEELLKKEWHSFPRARISPSLNRQEMEKCREQLAKKFRKSPSEQDVAWACLNNEAMNHARERNWGLFRNTRLSMAALLEKYQQPAEALKYYIEICYLDLNGPQNTGGLKDHNLRASLDIRDFNTEGGLLASAVVGKVLEIILTLKLNEGQVLQQFMQVANRNHTNLKLPVSPEKAWKIFSDELYL